MQTMISRVQFSTSAIRMFISCILLGFREILFLSIVISVVPLGSVRRLFRAVIPSMRSFDSLMQLPWVSVILLIRVVTVLKKPVTEEKSVCSFALQHWATNDLMTVISSLIRSISIFFSTRRMSCSFCKTTTIMIASVVLITRPTIEIMSDSSILLQVSHSY